MVLHQALNSDNAFVLIGPLRGQTYVAAMVGKEYAYLGGLFPRQGKLLPESDWTACIAFVKLPRVRMEPKQVELLSRVGADSVRIRQAVCHVGMAHGSDIGWQLAALVMR